MNFLRHSFSSSDLSSVSQDADREARSAPDAAASFASPARDSDGEDVRAAGDSLRTRNRVAIEDHTDVPEDAGGILLPSRELPKNWNLSGDMTSLFELDRGFLFPGEQLNIVVYISSHDALMPEIITPFKVAAMMDKVSLVEPKEDEGNCEALSHEILNGSVAVEENQKLPAGARESCSSMEATLPVSESLLRMEGHKKTSAELLHSFENSHFFTRISGADEQLWKKQTAFDQAEDLDEGIMSGNLLERKKSLQSVGSVPVVIEGGDFDPKIAGGVARNATCCSLGNGDTAVVLRVAVATDLKYNVVLEVLQFEQPWKSDGFSTKRDMEDSSKFHENYSNSSEQLLQWLLPLDCPSSPPISTMLATPASFVNSSPQRISFSGSAGSTLFSFANLRMSSSGSTSQSFHSSVSSTPPQASSTHGSDEWDRPAGQRILKAQSVGNEGILSFRGTQVEPQRFSVHCGLEGLYVPGRRWRRNLEIVEPIAIESYFADCNTKDLICVLIENVIPDHLPGIVMTVDSISIVCQSASGPSSIPLSVPIACVEVGEDHRLPGLSLRRGEQHSLILKPSSSPFQMSVAEKGKDGLKNTLNGHELQTSKMSYNSSAGAGKRKAKEHDSNSFPDSRTYALVVSCRCSHTESRLRFKHPIQWRPRAPRDLLLSVSLEPTSAPMMPNGSFSPLLSQVLMVQATNLTSENLHLTLLAPSSRNTNSSAPAIQPAPRTNNFVSFRENKEWPVTKNEEINFEGEKSPSEASSMRPGSLQRSMSLPPARPIESIMGITPMVVKERAISAADIAAENSLAWTHLWLQSTVPLGSVPPQSTTAVRCEILPLTDGIITLDTLNISTKEQDAVYFPEKPLQIYATSSIGSGLL